jgi:hypothetical protein
MTEVVLGHLVVTVHESSGKNKDDADVWDPSFTEGFVKGVIMLYYSMCQSASVVCHLVEENVVVSALL